MTEISNDHPSKSSSKKWILIVLIGLLVLCGCVVSVMLLITFGFANYISNVKTDSNTLNGPSLLEQSRNYQRTSDLQMIVNAVKQYEEEKGEITIIPNCSAGAKNIGTNTGLVNLNKLLSPNYLVETPFDPVDGSRADTKYSICRDGLKTIQLEATQTEGLKENIKYSK